MNNGHKGLFEITPSIVFAILIVLIAIALIGVYVYGIPATAKLQIADIEKLFF